MLPFLRHIPKSEAQAVVISLTVGISLLTIKFVAYFLTQSAAIFSDATESIANVLASTVAMYSLAVAHRPADAEHPYGHGKAEFLSAWFEASMIVAAAVFIIIKTIDAISHGEIAREDSMTVGIILMTVAAAVNGIVGMYLIRTGRRQSSMTLVADGKHLLVDVYTTVAVLVALGVVKATGWRMFDPIMAFAISIYIAYSGASILRHAAAGIMDKQDIEDERLITQILDSHCGSKGKTPRICNYHKLRHRHSGRYHWIDFHIRLPETVSVRQAHEIASAIEEEIEAAVGEGNATAHVEPCDRHSCPPNGQCDILERYTPGSVDLSASSLSAPPAQKPS